MHTSGSVELEHLGRSARKTTGAECGTKRQRDRLAAFHEHCEFDARCDGGTWYIAEHGDQLAQRWLQLRCAHVALIGDDLVVEGDAVAYVSPHLEEHDTEVATATRPPVLECRV